MKLIVFVLSLIAFQVSYAQSHYLFSGTYTKSGKSKGIYVYTFNSTTGESRLISSTFTDNPSYLAFSKDNRYVYAVNEKEGGPGGVSSFAFDYKTGKLRYINKQLTNGAGPCYVSLDFSGKWVAVANYSGGSFSVLPVLKDGSLGPSVQSFQLNGGGVNKVRQEKAHAHSAMFTPDKHFLVIADLGSDKILVYPFDASKAKPVGEKPAEVTTDPGSGPRHLLFSPNKSFAYLVCEMSGNVTAYKYSNGKFDLLQKISGHPAGYKGEIGSAAIHMSADGRFLYTSNRGGSNTIAIFSVDPVSGKLASLGFVPTGGDHPRDFTLDPSGNFLFAGNMRSGTINIFKRDSKTGLLKPSADKILVPEPTHLLFMNVK